ncbi:peroxisomal membrane anchor protein conserved region-domain-containing protein [Haematococcus lacustris]
MIEEQNTTPPTESNAAAVPLAPVSTSPALLREDQVLNAVSFLTHPKVVDSPIATKRSFLERKGLTAEEIDEAFKRAPAPAPAATVSAATPTGLITYQAQPSQPAASAMTPAPASSVSPQHVPQHVQQAEPLRWTQVTGRVACGSEGSCGSLQALQALPHQPPLPYSSELPPSELQHACMQILLILLCTGWDEG